MAKKKTTQTNEEIYTPHTNYRRKRNIRDEADRLKGKQKTSTKPADETSNENNQDEDATAGFNLKTWGAFFKYLSPFKKYLFLGVFMVIIIAAIDAFYPYMTKLSVDNFIEKNSMDGFGIFMGAFIFIALFQSFGSFVMIIVNNRVATGFTHLLRMACFEKLQRLQINYFNNTPTGWIMSRMTSDIQKLANTLSGNLINLIQYVASIILYAIFMFSLNLKLALIVFSVIPVLVAISYFFQTRMLKNFRHVRRLNSIVTNSFSEGIAGSQTIKTMVTEDTFEDDFAEQTENMRNFAVRSARLANLYHPLVVLLANVGTALVLWRGGMMTEINIAGETISVGTLSAFLTYASAFFGPIQMIAAIFSEMQYAQASAERIVGLMNTEITIDDKPEVVEKYGDLLNPNKESWPKIKGDIKFRNVNFSYKPEEPIYENFNLHIKAGETIAIVGETGSGKTTLVNLICRFFEPTSGRILIDDIDYREMPMLWLYSNIGYVLQNAHLFSGTIRENIKYANHDATDEEIEAAAKMVNAHNFIMNMKDGYDTEVGEDGSRLSVGERQLVSFARAILSNPSIFILDEATSSVDTQTEHLIKDAIDKILEGRTSFLIAHRLSTIRSADRILVIDGGRVVEDGSHDELIAKGGRYYNLYNNQFLKREQMNW